MGLRTEVLKEIWRVLISTASSSPPLPSGTDDNNPLPVGPRGWCWLCFVLSSAGPGWSPFTQPGLCWEISPASDGHIPVFPLALTRNTDLALRVSPADFCRKFYSPPLPLWSMPSPYTCACSGGGLNFPLGAAMQDIGPLNLVWLGVTQQYSFLSSSIKHTHTFMYT